MTGATAGAGEGVAMMPAANDTLESAWKALFADLSRLEPNAVTSTAYRQAFKNGAAIILGRVLVRGSDSIPPAADTQESEMLAVSAAMTVMTFHPEWSDRHRDCVLAGALSMFTLLRAIGRSPHEARVEMENFRIEPTKAPRHDERQTVPRPMPVPAGGYAR